MADVEARPPGAEPARQDGGPPQQRMARELGWYASFSVAFGFVSIATGIFTTYGAVLGTSGSRGIWAWPISVIGQLSIALVFGALAARIPISGYSYQWVSRIVGPVWGWIMGWVSFAFLGVVLVAVDYTIASTILPELFQYVGTTQNAWVITAVVVLLQAVLVAASTRFTHRVNSTAVTVQLIGMIALTVLLFFRDASFRAPWIYVLVLFAIGAVYFAGLLLRSGRAGLTMPDLADVDRSLDTADTAIPRPKAAEGNAR
ncbi:amino acid permease [Streptomyces sp. NBC_01808]|uniref:amino acid permease n=1 Tax=Streptomyces sp. NBC_01808 TaxID=2975947 RepID=UPI002DDC33F6|nr:amino acid permease [Streptomyces sp. NBC_01808]WSA36115.1 amino acid permease [Streptomyces sp. NBC_01808]